MFKGVRWSNKDTSVFLSINACLWNAYNPCCKYSQIRCDFWKLADELIKRKKNNQKTPKPICSILIITSMYLYYIFAIKYRIFASLIWIDARALYHTPFITPLYHTPFWNTSVFFMRITSRFSTWMPTTAM